MKQDKTPNNLGKETTIWTKPDSFLLESQLDLQAFWNYFSSASTSSPSTSSCPWLLPWSQIKQIAHKHEEIGRQIHSHIFTQRFFFGWSCFWGVRDCCLGLACLGLGCLEFFWPSADAIKIAWPPAGPPFAGEGEFPAPPPPRCRYVFGDWHVTHVQFTS